MLDLAESSVVNKLSDAKCEISLMGVSDTPSGDREIKLEPAVVSDTMASWDVGEWAKNRDDLYFNFAAHFKVVCKTAREFGNVPEGYVVTCPDYMVVYDSRKSTGFVVTSTGVYRKTEDPDNPIGEVVALSTEK